MNTGHIDETRNGSLEMVNDPRHRAQHRQLWIDRVRDKLENTGLAADIDRLARTDILASLLGPGSLPGIESLPPAELALQFQKHGLNRPLADLALRALEAHGYPERELTPADWTACQAHVFGALDWAGFNILRNPESRVMLLDDRTAKALADSRNDEITAAELQHLPHNPCLIEFYRPITIAENVQNGVRLRGVGFQALGTATAPVAVAGFYLDCWETAKGVLWPATIAVWFGGFNIARFDEAANRAIGIRPGQHPETDTALRLATLRVARNLWDFVTSRSIQYERVKRKRPPNPPSPPDPACEVRPSHVQGRHSPADREVFLLYLSHASATREEPAQTSKPMQWGYRVEVPGKFHQYVYCAACGDLHRHDLLGQPCRKCGQTVGPRANLRIEKYWHHPYLAGPRDAPIKDVVRDIHRRKTRP